MEFDEEIRTLLKRNFELTRENNKLLKKIRRSMFVSNVMRIVWWAIIIGLPVFLYYYVLQPYLVELHNTYLEVQNGVVGAQDTLYNTPFIGNLLRSLFEGATTTPQ